MNSFYNQYKSNVYSQNGEDGLIQELFKRLKISNGWVCEFGACDGVLNSNTFFLVNKGFNAVYIEPDKKMYEKLEELSKSYNTINPINSLIDLQENTLDNVLSQTEIPEDFDLLSIDIDSYDYQVWDSLKNYNPKVVLIEIDSAADVRDPNHIYNPPQGYMYTGFKPMLELGLSKGYKFVCHSGNMIFVREDLYDMLDLEEPEDPLDNFSWNWKKKKI